MLKTVQVHNECICGHNEVFQLQVNFSWRMCRKMYGFPKYKSRTGDRSPWFLDYRKFATCDGFHHEQDREWNDFLTADDLELLNLPDALDEKGNAMYLDANGNLTYKQ